jgi:hypothetical protein
MIKEDGGEKILRAREEEKAGDILFCFEGEFTSQISGSKVK